MQAMFSRSVRLFHATIASLYEERNLNKKVTTLTCTEHTWADLTVFIVCELEFLYPFMEMCFSSEFNSQFVMYLFLLSLFVNLNVTVVKRSFHFMFGKLLGIQQLMF